MHQQSGNDDFIVSAQEELLNFRMEVGKSRNSLSPLQFFAECIQLKKFPRVVHAGIWLMGLPATNAPSESLWCDTGRVSDGKRNRISGEHLEQQVRLKRNHDLVKYFRALVGALPNKTLEEAWDRYRAVNT